MQCYSPQQQQTTTTPHEHSSFTDDDKNKSLKNSTIRTTYSSGVVVDRFSRPCQRV
jgi:hypothetical protein